MTENTRTLATPLYVVAVGAATALPGPTPTALDAIYQETRAILRHPVFVGPDGNRQICAPSPLCINTRDPVERILLLCEAAFRELAGAFEVSDVIIAVLPWWLREGSPFRPALERAIIDGRLGSQPIEVITGDAAAGATGLYSAAHRLSQQSASTVTLVSVDTAIAPAVLDMSELSGFAHTRRTRHIPVPGEAAIALVLSNADPQFSKIEMLLSKPELIRPTSKDRPLMGQTSADLLSSVIPAGSVFDLIADLDGERHRSEEFGFVSAIISPPRKVVVPAISVGYVGTATFPLQVAVAVSQMTFENIPKVCWTLARSGMRQVARVTRAEQLTG